MRVTLFYFKEFYNLQNKRLKRVTLNRSIPTVYGNFETLKNVYIISFRSFIDKVDSVILNVKL